MNNSFRSFPLSCRLGGGGLVIWAALSPASVFSQPKDTVSEEPALSVSAQWQAHDLRFHYAGFTTYYSCSGLEDRLEQILKEMGADEDVRVSTTGCFSMHDVSNMISARIRVRMPATTATTESVQTQSFAATNKTVSLPTRRNGENGAGDCELLEQVRDQLLPALKLRALKDDLHCVPGHGMVGNRSLQVMALVAEPAQQ